MRDNIDLYTEIKYILLYIQAPQEIPFGEPYYILEVKEERLEKLITSITFHCQTHSKILYQILKTDTLNRRIL